ncbi:28S ribosomal protein S18c, mitochondrial-like [Psammomys obesus]|uniref:28S ribosomal protein S18c, mitochondrial-like n=1 Tax=Psammomys obesus TaxID=48139 RepID=UPI0024528E45|nr:28S ribosomal protein S18c, mitochondrial-like [Psammomys obesus]
MAAMAAVCSAVEEELDNRGCLPHRAHAVTVLWRRRCSQYKQVASNKDLTILYPYRENPYKEPLKKCVLFEEHVDYKNIQIFVERNRQKFQRPLRELRK